MKTLRIFSLIFCLSMLFACSKKEEFNGSVGLIVLPSSVEVKLGEQKQFEATVFNSSSKILWSVDGGDSNGTVDSTGLYTAPAQRPPEAHVTLRAKLVENNQVQATASLTLTE